VIPKLQAQAEAAVRLLGYTPTTNAMNAPQLTVTLAELKYQSPKDSMYVTEATIGATFRSDVKNGNRTYSGRYGASLDQRFGMAPNQETNTKLVSDVLSDALTRRIQRPFSGQSFAGRVTVESKKPEPGEFGLFCARRVQAASAYSSRRLTPVSKSSSGKSTWVCPLRAQ
jgi:hypothetical protein